MSLSDFFSDMDRLASDARKLLEEEIYLQRYPEEAQLTALLERKCDLIDELDAVVREVRAIRMQADEALNTQQYPQLGLLQQKFMQLLKLDRDLERQILARPAGRRSEAPAEPQRTGARSVCSGHVYNRYSTQSHSAQR